MAPISYNIKDRGGFFDFCRKRAAWYAETPIITFSIGGAIQTVLPNAAQIAKDIVDHARKLVLYAIKVCELDSTIALNPENLLPIAQDLKARGNAQELNFPGGQIIATSISESGIAPESLTTSACKVAALIIKRSHLFYQHRELGQEAEFSTQRFREHLTKFFATLSQGAVISQAFEYACVRSNPDKSLNAGEIEVASAISLGLYVQAASKISYELEQAVSRAIAVTFVEAFERQCANWDDVHAVMIEALGTGKTPNLDPAQFVRRFETSYLPQAVSKADCEKIKAERNNIIKSSCEFAGIDPKITGPSPF
jgi:hypothetical protein